MSQTSDRHHLLEDIQALFSGTLIFAFAILLFRQAEMLTGGTAGLAFLAYYVSDLPFGLLYFLINLPFYAFGLRALGQAFTVKTFCAVSLLSIFSETLPHFVRFERLDPLLAAEAEAGARPLAEHLASEGFGQQVHVQNLQSLHRLGWVVAAGTAGQAQGLLSRPGPPDADPLCDLVAQAG